MLLNAFPPALLSAENSVSPQSSVNFNTTKTQKKHQRPISENYVEEANTFEFLTDNPEIRDRRPDREITCPMTPSHLSPMRAMMSSTDKMVFFCVHI